MVLVTSALVVVYPLLYLLIPKLLLRKKFLLFVLSYIALIFLGNILGDQLHQRTSLITNLRGYNFWVGKYFLPFIHISGLAAALKFMRYYYFRETEAEYEEEQKNAAEIELLKTQIHPNFLFNTLNNLFAHTIRKSEETPQIVLKLSDLLRFMIYEGKCNYIPLSHEIDLLRNYIELEKLRHDKSLDLSFIVTGDPGQQMIRPLLLLPLVENAFRICTMSNAEQKWLSMTLNIESTKLKFNIVNSFTSAGEELELLDEGFKNVRKRLELMYHNNYVLITRSEEDIFLISLELEVENVRSIQEVGVLTPI